MCTPKAYFVAREIGLSLINNPSFVCVDSSQAGSEGSEKYRFFNPFLYHENPCIKVPGTTLFSHSVEGIWQGLKQVYRQTDFALLSVLPYKRPSEEERKQSSYNYSLSEFQFNGETIGIIEARLLIYLPAYLYLLEHVVPQSLFEQLAKAYTEKRKPVFFDWDPSGDIFNAHQSFSHSSVLAAYFNHNLVEIFFEPGAAFLASRGLIYEWPQLERYYWLKSIMTVNQG